MANQQPEETYEENHSGYTGAHRNWTSPIALQFCCLTYLALWDGSGVQGMSPGPQGWQQQQQLALQAGDAAP